jgi:hypothetical protein
MSLGGHKPNVFWIGFGILLLLTVLLGLRSERAISSIIASVEEVDAGPQDTSPLNRSTQAEEMKRRRGFLATALPAERDPFRATPKAPPSPAPEPGETRPPVQKYPDVPSLRGFLYDNVSPAAKIQVGGRESSWLKMGERFQGWTISDFSPNSVRVSKGNKHYNLRAQVGGER